MRTQTASRDHVFLLDRMRGTYVDAGEATRTDRILSHFSGGRVRIAPPRSDRQEQANVDGFDAKPSAERQMRDVIGG